MKRKLLEYQSYLLICHVNPDGDSLGSAVGLALGLKKLGKRVDIAVDGKLPRRLNFLLDGVQCLTAENIGKYDCAVAVDCADISMLGELEECFLSCKDNAVIDHHPTNPLFGKINFVEKCAATGLLVMKLLKEMEVEIDFAIARALYVSIMMDTGNFCHANTSPDVFRAAAELVEKGLDVSVIYRTVFDENTLGATLLIVHAINSMELFAGGKVAISSITRQDYDDCNASSEDSEGLINYARRVEGVQVSAFIKEVDTGKYRVSFRSRGADVSVLAASFGGGGHARAAGCTIYGELQDIRARLAKELSAILES